MAKFGNRTKRRSNRSGKMGKRASSKNAKNVTRKNGNKKMKWIDLVKSIDKQHKQNGEKWSLGQSMKEAKKQWKKVKGGNDENGKEDTDDDENAS
jgi:hypothetical protein